MPISSPWSGRARVLQSNATGSGGARPGGQDYNLRNRITSPHPFVNVHYQEMYYCLLAVCIRFQSRTTLSSLHSAFRHTFRLCQCDRCGFELRWQSEASRTGLASPEPPLLGFGWVACRRCYCCRYRFDFRIDGIAHYPITKSEKWEGASQSLLLRAIEM